MGTTAKTVRVAQEALLDILRNLGIKAPTYDKIHAASRHDLIGAFYAVEYMDHLAAAGGLPRCPAAIRDSKLQRLDSAERVSVAMT